MRRQNDYAKIGVIKKYKNQNKSLNFKWMEYPFKENSNKWWKPFLNFGKAGRSTKF